MITNVRMARRHCEEALPSADEAICCQEIAFGSLAMTGPLVALSLASVLAGCGLKRVDAEVVARLPLESKIELLEAENDLYIAIDRHDEAVDRALHTRDELHRARDRISEAKDARNRAEQTKDPRQVEVASLAVEEAYQKRDWLEDWVDVQWALASAEDARLDAAKGRFERAKASMCKKANIKGSEKLDMPGFEAQVKSLESRAKRKAESAEADRKKAEEVRSKWNSTRRALAQKTGGALGSAWVE
jgi:hypothetical protein